jgi:hypothetical protein
LDERTRQIVAKTKNATRDFDRQRFRIDQVFIPISNQMILFLIDYAQKLIYNNNSKITILDVKDMRRIIVIQSAVTL